MDIKPIRSDDDLTNAFIRLENIFQADEAMDQDHNTFNFDILFFGLTA